MSSAESSSDPVLDLRAALAALAALLPPLLIALPAPLSWLEGDPWPQYSAAALALIASLASLIFLGARRPERIPRGVMLVLTPLLIAVLWRTLGEATDQLEATRALHVLLAGTASFLGVALLSDRGLRIYLRGLCVISVMLFLGFTDSIGGVLGNSGSLSHMALAGACVGLWFLMEGSKAERVLGGAALGLFLAHAARTPVLAGSLSLLAGVVAAWALRPRWRSSRLMLLIGLLALAALLTPLMRISDATQPMPVETSRPALTAGHAGGIGVRLSVWKSSLELAREHVLVGVGPGQFAAAFPPWRSVEEIERSSLGRTLAAETEVDHPHNDWLARLCELGIVGLFCMLLLAGLAVLTLHRERERTAPLLIASTALLTNSCFHGVFGYDAGSAVVAMGVLGAVLSTPVSGIRAGSVRWTALLLIGAVALELPRAKAVLLHGHALSAIGRDGSTMTLQRVGEQALQACPDSVHARAIIARLTPDENSWRAVLEQRPERMDAWMQLGNLRARSHDTVRALDAYDHAFRLDPWHPGLLENRLTLLSRMGTLEATQRALTELRARKPVAADWLLNRARTAWLHGNEDCARWLHDQAGLGTWPQGPDAAYAQFRAVRQTDDATAAAFFESVAQRGFARRDAEQARYKEAARNYRQDLLITGAFVPEGAPRVRWEYAACLQAQGDRALAESQINGLAPVRDLPEWVVKALESRP